MALPAGVQAHISGFTDTSIQVAATGVRIIYTLPSDNLLELLPTGASKPEKVVADDFIDVVRQGWSVASGGERCLLTQTSAQAVTTVNSQQFQFTYVCPHGMDSLQIRYSLFFARWADHENFVRVFMAGQRNRMRFTSERQDTTVPVAQLLSQWGRPLAAGFFDKDPHRALQLAGAPDGQGAVAGQDPTPPRIVEPEPSLGKLNLSQVDPGFIRLGVDHIFAGLDHVLFVVGLVLLTHSWRRLLLLVSAFTLAHSVTMALSTLGLIDFKAAWAEPLIALTIVYIGLENLWALRSPANAHGQTPGEASGAAVWRRALLVFVFGLVHGVGFSYTLREMGLREDLLGSLLFFNGGVELGQLGIIAVTLPLTLLIRRMQWSRSVLAVMSAGVLSIGVFMLINRI